MSSLYRAHPLRTVRSFGFLSKSRFQLRLSQFDRVPPLHHGRQPGVRFFSVAPAILTTIHSTVDTIISIHAITHIPWFLLIPCFSIGVNAISRLPFAVYTRKLHQRQAKASLVMQGWGWRVPQAIHKDGIPRDQGRKEAEKRISRIRSRIDRALGTQRWRMFSNMLTFPVWLVGIESIRQICGGPRGMLGNLFMGRIKSEDAVPSVQEGTGAAMSPTDISSAASQGSLIDPPTTSIVTDHARNILDPSIASEGCLWFPDLSVADPYHILPFALSAMLVVNMMPKGGIPQLLNLNKSNDASTLVGPQNLLGLRLSRASVVVALLVGPCTADMPAALHLYWLVSSTMSYVMNKVLAHLIPIERRQVERCKGAESNIIQPRRKTASRVEEKNTEQKRISSNKATQS